MSRVVLPAPVRAPKPRKQTAAERAIEVAHIRARDKACVLSFLLPPGHVCRGQWGDVIRPDDLGLLTFEHVKEGLGGRRPPLDRWHVVLACWDANVWKVETSKYRQKIRDYLAEKEPKPLDSQGE